MLRKREKEKFSLRGKKKKGVAKTGDLKQSA